MTYLLAFRGLLGRIPWQVWAILGLAVAVMIYGNHREAQGRYEGRAEMQAKIDRADADRAKALASEEQALRNLAQRTDRNVTQARAENRDRTERFIASGGVRNACPGGDQAPRAGAGSGDGVHQAPVMDDPETVSVKPDDVRICTANTITAEALQAYLMGLDYPER
jgi:hypothetical protein